MSKKASFPEIIDFFQSINVTIDFSGDLDIKLHSFASLKGKSKPFFIKNHYHYLMENNFKICIGNGLFQENTETQKVAILCFDQQQSH